MKLSLKMLKNKFKLEIKRYKDYLIYTKEDKLSTL